MNKRNTGSECLRRAGRLGLLAGGLLLGACSSLRTEPPAEAKPLSPAQLGKLESMGQDERKFWITRIDRPSGPDFLNANRLHPDRLATLDFNLSTSAPVVQVVFDMDNKCNALIDSSSPGNWCSFRLAQKNAGIPLGKPVARAYATHVPDEMPGFVCLFETMQVDQMPIENLLVALRGAEGGLGPLARGLPEKKLDLVLGAELLKKFRFVQIDFPGRRVLFSTRGEYKPSSERLLARLPILEDAGLMTTMTANGREYKALVDTAGAFFVAWPPEEPVPTTIGLGDAQFSRVPLVDTATAGVEPTACPRIGRYFLSSCVVTIDGKNGWIYLEKPATGK